MRKRGVGVLLDFSPLRIYHDLAMRVYEVLLSSGVRAEILAEVMHDDKAEENIYFFRDKSMKHLVAYFQRKDVSGIIFGAEKAPTIASVRYK